MNYQKLINTNIKLVRINNNLTQEEFAEKIGLSIQGLSNIERNRYQPSAETIDKICKSFNLSPAQLLTVQCNSNKDIIENITTMLQYCSKPKLKKIYEILLILTKI